jgi:hypothetical protein
LGKVKASTENRRQNKGRASQVVIDTHTYTYLPMRQSVIGPYVITRNNRKIFKKLYIIKAKLVDTFQKVGQQ